MFKKFYEKGNEIEYETEQPLSLNETWKALYEVFSSLKDVNVIDVYYEEVEIVEKKITNPTIVVDVYTNDNKNLVYLIYVKDLDEYTWKEIKEEIGKKYKSGSLNICDEDEMYISFCTWFLFYQ